MNQYNEVCYVYASGYSLINGNKNRYVRTAERKCFDQTPSQGLILFNVIYWETIIQYTICNSKLEHLGCDAVYMYNKMYTNTENVNHKYTFKWRRII